MSLAGEAVVSIWHDIADAGRDDFYWWHLHEHMPERVGIPGFLRGRRYIAEEGRPEFFTLYEAMALETLAGQDYFARLNNPTPWTQRAVKHFKNVARAVQRVRYSAGPGMGGHLLTMRFEVAQPDRFVENIDAEVLSHVRAKNGIAGVHLCETELAVSDTRTKEKEGRDGGTDMPGWCLMIEAARRDEIDQVRGAWFTESHCNDLGMTGNVEMTIYRLEYIRTKTSHSC